MRELKVNLGERSYSICIGAGSLSKAGACIAEASRAGRFLLVSNARVHGLYGERVEKALQSQGYEVLVSLMPDGEQYKNMDEAMKIIDRAIAWNLDRSGGTIALGGGVVGDLAGLVAAIIHRGIDFIQLPTTLLAQVDSSVGGKVAVNHPRGKNLLGAFHQPRLVLIDPLSLMTLEEREYRGGLGELVKYGIACDPGFFGYLEEHVEQIKEKNLECIEEVIYQACRIKAAVVEEDEKETSHRMVLNLGHTFGHSLEMLGEYQALRHGEAVAMGTIAAAFMALEMGYIDERQLNRIGLLYQTLGLATRFPGYNPEEVYAGMMNDKKSTHNRLRFILPKGIGAYVVAEDPPRELVYRAIRLAQKYNPGD
ncbi:MAG: 3-dehydroquinate synthase [Syntrophomonadaceae bacterium]